MPVPDPGHVTRKILASAARSASKSYSSTRSARSSGGGSATIIDDDECKKFAPFTAGAGLQGSAWGDCDVVDVFIRALKRCNGTQVTAPTPGVSLAYTSRRPGIKVDSSHEPDDCLQDAIDSAGAYHIEIDHAVAAGIVGGIFGGAILAYLTFELLDRIKGPKQAHQRTLAGAALGLAVGGLTAGLEGLIGAGMAQAIAPYSDFRPVPALVEGGVGGAIMGLIGGAVSGALSEGSMGAVGATSSVVSTFAGCAVGAAALSGTSAPHSPSPRIAFGAATAGAGWLCLFGIAAGLGVWGLCEVVAAAQKSLKGERPRDLEQGHVELRRRTDLASPPPAEITAQRARTHAGSAQNVAPVAERLESPSSSAGVRENKGPTVTAANRELRGPGSPATGADLMPPRRSWVSWIGRSASGTPPSSRPAPAPEDVVKCMLVGEVPERFICPISSGIMTNPVSTMEGHTYDYESIARWLSVPEHNRDPLTNLPLKSKNLIPNMLVRSDYAAFRAEVARRNPGVNIDEQLPPLVRPEIDPQFKG